MNALVSKLASRRRAGSPSATTAKDRAPTDTPPRAYSFWIAGDLGALPIHLAVTLSLKLWSLRSPRRLAAPPRRRGRPRRRTRPDHHLPHARSPPVRPALNPRKIPLPTHTLPSFAHQGVLVPLTPRTRPLDALLPLDSATPASSAHAHAHAHVPSLFLVVYDPCDPTARAAAAEQGRRVSALSGRAWLAAPIAWADSRRRRGYASAGRACEMLVALAERCGRSCVRRLPLRIAPSLVCSWRARQLDRVPSAAAGCTPESPTPSICAVPARLDAWTSLTRRAVGGGDGSGRRLSALARPAASPRGRASMLPDALPPRPEEAACAGGGGGGGAGQEADVEACARPAPSAVSSEPVVVERPQEAQRALSGVGLGPSLSRRADAGVEDEQREREAPRAPRRRAKRVMFVEDGLEGKRRRRGVGAYGASVVG
jgi:hypothetical protein